MWNWFFRELLFRPTQRPKNQLYKFVCIRCFPFNAYFASHIGHTGLSPTNKCKIAAGIGTAKESYEMP